MRKQMYFSAVLGSFMFLMSGMNNVYGQVHSRLYSFVLLDKLEYQVDDGSPISWELTSWYGGDFNRVWLKGEGDILLREVESDIELQLLFSRLVTSFWELQAGVRSDLVQSETGWDERFYAVLGLEGMAPYWLEIEPVLFMDTEGNLSARLATTRDLRVTQRTLVELSAELNASPQTVEELQLGNGLRDIDLGFRLRHELRREIAPYAGISWARKIGETADFAEAVSGDKGSLSLVVGIRLWR